jgi:hypothetical protein
VHVPWEAWNNPGQSVWLPSRRQKSAQPPASLVACGSTRPRSLPPPPGKSVNHGCTGLQGLDDPAVTSAFTGFRDIGLQQYPRLQQRLRRALSRKIEGKRRIVDHGGCGFPHASCIIRASDSAYCRVRSSRVSGVEAAAPVRALQSKRLVEPIGQSNAGLAQLDRDVFLRLGHVAAVEVVRLPF